MACLLPIFFWVAAVAGSGDRFWEKKSYRTWSKEECLQLLQKSPWATSSTETTVVIMGKGIDGKFDMPSGINPNDSSQPYIKYQVQIRSAMPIRQALVRQEQIEQKYDKLSSQQREFVDKQVEAFLSADLSDIVVMTVTYTTNYQPFELDLSHYWQSQTTNSLKNDVNLIDSNGNRFPLLRYDPLIRGFQITFPRRFEDRQTQVSPDKSLKLEFPYPLIGNIGNKRAFFEFPAENMQINGKIIF